MAAASAAAGSGRRCLIEGPERRAIYKRIVHHWTSARLRIVRPGCRAARGIVYAELLRRRHGRVTWPGHPRYGT